MNLVEKGKTKMIKDPKDDMVISFLMALLFFGISLRLYTSMVSLAKIVLL